MSSAGTGIQVARLVCTGLGRDADVQHRPCRCAGVVRCVVAAGSNRRDRAHAPCRRPAPCPCGPVGGGTRQQRTAGRVGWPFARPRAGPLPAPAAPDGVLALGACATATSVAEVWWVLAVGFIRLTGPLRKVAVRRARRGGGGGRRHAGWRRPLTAGRFLCCAPKVRCSRCSRTPNVA